MERLMIYEPVNKKNNREKKRATQIKQILKPLQHQSLNEAEKHHSTHVLIVECVELILRNQPYMYTAVNIFKNCKSILGARAGLVALIDRTGKYFDNLHIDSGGMQSAINYETPIPIRGFRQEVLQKGTVQFCNDFGESKWVKLLPEGHVKLQNVLLAPLMIDKTPAGILGFANKNEGFDNIDIHIASSFAKLASLALSNSKAWHVMKRNNRTNSYNKN